MYRLFYFILFGTWPQEKAEPEKPHACEEFTRWTNRRQRVLVSAHNGVSLPEDQRLETTWYWQERRCTLCGKLEQRNVVLPVEDEMYDDEEDD